MPETDKNSGRILVVDDDEDVLLAAKMLLKPKYALVRCEKDPRNIPTILQDTVFDVILLDMNFNQDVSSGSEGFHWLQQILALDPSVVVIFITAFGDVEKAVRAMKEGATDFVLKPWQNEKLLATVSAAMQLRHSRIQVEQLKSQQQRLQEDIDQQFPEIIGSSAAIRKVFNMIDKVAATDANVLILGESGTGKELVARAIHRRSNRSESVFIGVDLGALSETLFESELFGHVKGAFTDARSDRPGRFEIASGGTLFLDEIGNLSVSMQNKLLTVLQNRQVVRLGSNQYKPIDIRLICATNMPIDEMVEDNRFRQDLFYRINTVEINVPPLRERRDDIEQLAHYFVDLYSRKYQKPVRRISDASMQRLKVHSWPGNIRELQHTLERAVILSEETVLQPPDLFLPTAGAGAPVFDVDRYHLETIEKMTVRKALEKHQGNISRAAEELGLTRAALYRRMEKYDL